jgi:FtsZ-binding cell division protein ZapB
MPGNGEIMLPVDFDVSWTWLINGLLGILLVFGLSSTPAKPETKVKLLQHEIDNLKKKNKHLTGTSRLLENANGNLQKTVRQTDDRLKESQLTRARLNGEVVRRGNQIRSLEYELYLERKKVTGRR